MSYDISLCDPVSREVLSTDEKHQMCGGTYAVGGTREMWLNITWNYADWYYMPGVFSKSEETSRGIRTIYGMSGAESIPFLKKAIAELESMDEDLSETERSEYEEKGVTGYWIPTRKNAIRPLYQLLAFAQMRPDGVWEGD